MDSRAAVISATAISTFEDLGLLFASAGLTEAQREASLSASATISFRGVRTGSVHLDLFGDVIHTMAGNMLGIAKRPDPSVTRDAVGEMANVLSGTVLPALLPQGSGFRLTPPAVTIAPTHTPGPPAHATMISIGLEDGWARVAVAFDDEEESADRDDGR